jgi:hypothetical protein
MLTPKPFTSAAEPTLKSPPEGGVGAGATTSSGDSLPPKHIPRQSTKNKMRRPDCLQTNDRRTFVTVAIWCLRQAKAPLALIQTVERLEDDLRLWAKARTGSVYEQREIKPEQCQNEFTLKEGYFCERPKGHRGDHGAQCPNPQFWQCWPDAESDGLRRLGDQIAGELRIKTPSQPFTEVEESTAFRCAARTDESSFENAVLIEAAPDMYEALNEITFLVRSVNAVYDVTAAKWLLGTPAFQKAEIALRKARGGQ